MSAARRGGARGHLHLAAPRELARALPDRRRAGGRGRALSPACARSGPRSSGCAPTRSSRRASSTQPTALALYLFRAARVEVGAIEVGLGGRLDSTNAVEARVSVVTAIQLEHTDKLGKTLEAIAREKAGIFRAGAPALHGPLAPEAWGALAAQAIAVDTSLEEVAARDVRASEAGVRFRLDDGRELASRVLGAHQATNLALAARASEVFLGRALAPRELGALESLELPARLERLGDAILDDAHTPDSARALRETLERLWPGTRFVFVLSVSRDKDVAGIVSELAPVTRACVATAAEATRSRDPDELAALAWSAGIADVEVERAPVAALARARALLQPGDRLCVSGSVFLAGALRAALGRRRARRVDCRPRKESATWP